MGRYCLREEDLQAALEKKYNGWCERRPLVCADGDQHNRVLAQLVRDDLAPSERDAFYLHELAGCGGIEFVAFSNARFNTPVILSGGVTLVPCFLSTLEGRNMNDTMVGLTLSMMNKGRYIYDGWIEIPTWNDQSVRSAVHAIHQALSVFCLHGSIYFEWESKYIALGQSRVLYKSEHLDLEGLEGITSAIDSLDEPDRRAIYSSLGWLSQGVLLVEPAAKFLFSFLAIESLATHIEENASDHSLLLTLRTERISKAERRTQRDRCIRELLAAPLGQDLRNTIERAYFDCVTPITKKLKGHLGNVFKLTPAAVSLLFTEKVEGKSLYDLRHDIAHGTADALSEVQREQIFNRAWEVERIARQYIMTVLTAALGVEELSTDQFFFMASKGVFSSEGMYQGPTHMAVLYS
jgi:hypothetical protein